MSSSSSFAASLALVLDEVRSIRELRRSARNRFAVDVCLVAHRVRTGYLVDALSPSNPERTFAALLKALRAKSVAFEHVVCWHHAPTAQSFLVHMPLLRARLAAVGDCAFIHLGERPCMALETPEKLREALRDMECVVSDAPVLSLSDAFTQDILVPLAAVMIDYPVAYVPAHSAQISFLEGEPLDIYTISFQERASMSGVGKEHVLFKFSSPHVLANNHPELSPGQLIEKLKLKFSTRLEHIGMRIVVTHHTEALDRVAL